ncbi:malate synthase A [Thermaurantiacus tibetensis]|uniref:malate synthase A n=1 Tax=Thermaurantiacus tibetensis TaxID=2759035 RepID=UPI001F2760F1|nr:malate synthase A [Thermaurantiacus tibetensis]
MAVEGVEILGEVREGWREILSDPALAFLARLHRAHEPTRQALLAARSARRALLRAGEPLDFPAETAAIRAGDWRVRPAPADLQDRRVEITGPCSAKMVINALNSGAKCFMACLEDATSPTWANIVEGQLNLRAAVAGTLAHEEKGKAYRLADETAVLICRPRGWHLPEAHILVDGAEMAGALVDFGLYAFHNARALVEKGTGPYFYLPKLEHYLEARLWRDVFAMAESALGLPLGTMRATVLIETLPAAFMAEEILYELRDHIVGLNCGRWDYIFSYIKTFAHDPAKVLPDRAAVTMTVPFMAAYAAHVVRTCHRRGAHAMGGMSAFIPVKDDPARNEAAFAAVRADKEREARLGHDGTWVAHPALVPVAREVFDRLMPAANQLSVLPPGEATAEALTTPSEGPRTAEGLAMNVNVAIGYIAAWLRGQGAVPLHNLMEDAATAEISRAQLWQWRHHGVTLEDGRQVTAELVRDEIARQLEAWKAEVGDNFFASGLYREAADLLDALVMAEDLPDFLTLPAYRRFLAG